MTTALITGITGQDGSYLAEHLLDLGYRVVGVTRRTSAAMTGRLTHLLDRIELVGADLLDQSSLLAVVSCVQPDEVYNLAAQSFVPASFQQPILTAETTALGATRLLEAVRLARPDARFYQASSSEMFGHVSEMPQTERTPFHPRSPYGVAKLYAHWIAVNYRESYGLHVSSGILFNHESPRRGPEFVTRRISMAVAAIVHGRTRELALGNLDARRDWGYAPDYVRAMHRMLQQSEPRDYVIATGATHSVRDFCEAAFAHVGLDYADHVVFDPAQLRPADVDLLVGDASLARAELDWAPTVDFPELVRIMVDADMERARAEPPRRVAIPTVGISR
ncbi:MAG TPA: GDP-mannose 4,6-dehydratase [Thermomicrobiales bacterium]|nr:GDP-mannose 4,6-dehydratase [Thermomicrobiales bacterium]